MKGGGDAELVLRLLCFPDDCILFWGVGEMVGCPQASSDAQSDIT